MVHRISTLDVSPAIVTCIQHIIRLSGVRVAAYIEAANGSEFHTIELPVGPFAAVLRMEVVECYPSEKSGS